MGGGCPRSTCIYICVYIYIYTHSSPALSLTCAHTFWHLTLDPHVRAVGFGEMFRPIAIPAYASVNLLATLEVGGRGQQWAKGFAKQQQAKALHIPKGRPLASSYITKSSLLVHHMGSHDLFYLMPRGQELVQFNLGLMPRKAMVLGLWSSSPPSPIYAPPPHELFSISGHYS